MTAPPSNPAPPPDATTATAADTWAALEPPVRAELVRLGVPPLALETHTESARRIWNARSSRDTKAPPEREAARLAHRAVLADCADAITLAIARMLGLRRVSIDRQGDIAQETLGMILANDRLDDFEPLAPPEDPTLALHRRAVARYVTGFAWRIWSNETARERRQAALRASLLPPEPARDDVRAEVAELLEWVHRQLSPLDREVFLRCVVEEQTQPEAAMDLNLSVKALDARMHRIRQRIRAWLGERSRPALVPLALALGPADLDALLRHVAEHARRGGEPSPDQLRRVRERVERGLVDPSPPPSPPLPPRPPPARVSRASAGSFAALSAALGFVSALALRPPAPPPSPSPAPPPVAPLRAPPARDAQVVFVVPSTAALVPAPTVPAPTVARPRPAPVRTPASAVSPRAPAPTDTTASESPLARENSILTRAQSALAARPAQTTEALEAIDEHAQRYPSGQLTELREFLRVRALRASNRPSDATSAEADFRSRFPRSPFLARLDARPGARP